MYRVLMVAIVAILASEAQARPKSCPAAPAEIDHARVVLEAPAAASKEQSRLLGPCPKGSAPQRRVIGVGTSDIATVTELFCRRLSDGKRHGRFRSLSGKQTLDTGRYREGQRHGTWISRGMDGKTRLRGGYRRGHRDGAWTSYHSAKAVAWHGRFVCGKREGRFTWWNPDGTVMQERVFSPKPSTGRR